MFTLLLILGLTVTLNAGFAATTDKSTTNTAANSYQTSQQLSTNSTSEGAAGSNTTAIKTVKVLIYNGNYAAYSCVTGIETALDSANTNNLVPGYTFTYATSTVINSATLAPYDVLAMPGGSSGYYYLQSSSISATAIKNFVSSGKGYLGICAGAYSGSYYVQDYYYGWGVAPDVTCTHPNHEGDLTVQITSAGQQLFGYGDIITMVHYNGPAMYASGNAVVFAKYADNIINSNGMAAIVGDFYGNGRTVLSGPHPELSPQYPDMVANLIVWAANLTSAPNPNPTSTASLAQAGNAAASVKSYYESNKVLPGNVDINGDQVSVPQLLYLLANGIVGVNSGTTAAINIKTVNPAPAPSGTFKTGSIQKAEFVQLSKDLISFINTKGRAPNYQQTSLGKISFDKLVFMYTKIMTFYSTNQRLPNLVSM